MTINTELRKVGPYLCDGSDVSFPFSFKVFTTSDLLVILADSSGNVQILTYSSDYTVTLNNNQDTTPGGNITTVVAYEAGYKIIITSDLSYTQLVKLTNAGGFYPTVLNGAYDRATIQIQQLEEKIGRSIKAEISDGFSIDMTLPPAVSRANKFLSFNGSGEPISVAPVSGSMTEYAIDVANDSNISLGAGLVGYRGRTVYDRLYEMRSPFDFGAIGDGITDDLIAIQDAINSLSNGCVLDLRGKTFKVSGALTVPYSNVTIRNGTIDFSSVNGAGVDYLISVYGSIGSASAFTADTLLNSQIVTIANTSGFVAGDLVFIASSAVWDAQTATTFGQYARIKSIESGTQIKLYSSVLMDFRLAEAATISKVTPIKNVIFDNINLLGAGTGSQAGIYIMYGENVTVQNCNFENIDYVSCALWRCYKSEIVNCHQKHATNTGNAYAYAIWGGCYGCKVINSWGEDCRHTVTIGDNDGINLFNMAIGCHATSSKDSGFDSHSGSMYTSFIGNHVEMSAERFLTSNHEGIIIQGLHAVITDNIVIGSMGAAIIHNPLCQAGYKSSAIISNNVCDVDDIGYGGISGRGIIIYVDDLYGANVDGVVIQGNTFKGGLNNVSGVDHITLYNDKINATLKNAIISGNISIESATSSGVFLRSTEAGAIIENVVISNNLLKSDSTVIYVLTENATAQINYITGGDNIIDGPTIGIYLNALAGEINNARFGKNIYRNVTTEVLAVNTESYIFDDADNGTPITFSGSPGTILGKNNWYIINRGSAVVVNLPDPTKCKGRILHFKNIAVNALDSALSNVVPIDSDTAGTAILPATDGAWCQMYSDGVNWVIMMSG